MADSTNQDELVDHFAAIAGVTSRQARQYLAANNWNLEAAMTEYFQAQEERGTAQDHDDVEADPDYEDESDHESTNATTQSLHGQGRRLGDAPTEPVPSLAEASAPKKSTQQKKFATLGDFGSSNGAKYDEEDDEENQDLFAGGEKSGLAVQNPDDLKKRILEKAMRRQKPRTEDPKPASHHFTGSARTLGGDDAPSREIPAAEPPTSTRPQRVERTLHFWNDGFSIDDGDLYSTQDPRNAEILNGIRQGRAPLHIMGVMPGQEVDVEIKQHQENYVKPKKKFTPFGGQGNRLGSPTPGVSTMPGSYVSEPTAPTPVTATTTIAEVDPNKPQLTLRISLGDGTRLTSRFNTDNTIDDVYTFVQRTQPTGREYVLQTTFPTKVLDDKQAVLGELAEFKRGGGVVVQKFT